MTMIIMIIMVASMTASVSNRVFMKTSCLTFANVSTTDLGIVPFSQTVRKFSISSRVTAFPSTDIILNTTKI